MGKMIQIRDVPDDLHASLKERAARERTTLSALILRDLPRIAYRPSPEEVLRRIGSRAAAAGGPAGADLVREDRDGDRG